MKKELLIVVVTITFLIGFIAIFIYFVTGVSATYPPIRKYSYSGTPDELIGGLRKYSSSIPDVTFKVTDTTGDVNNNCAFYVSIAVRNVEFTLKCEEHYSNDEGNTLVMLVGIYDRIRNVGGYSRDAEEIDVLVDRFLTDVLTPLKTEIGIELYPL